MKSPNKNHNQRPAGFAADPVPTPTRFLMEGGNFNFTPGLLTSLGPTETDAPSSNPFESSFKQQSQSLNQESISPADSVLRESDQMTGVDTIDGIAASIEPAKSPLLSPITVAEKDRKLSLSPKSPPKSARRKLSRNSVNSASLAVQSDGDDSDSDGEEHDDSRSTSTAATSNRPRKRSKSDIPGKDLAMYDQQGNGADDGSDRDKLLKKNRVAATKCRMKKKQWIMELESRAEEAGKIHTELNNSITALKDELITLKNMLLAHRNCNCNLIQKYIHSSGQFRVDGHGSPSSSAASVSTTSTFVTRVTDSLVNG